MDWLDEILEFGGDAVDTAGDYLGDAFDWFNEDKELRNLIIGGAAKGVGGYLIAQEAAKDARELEELRQRREDNRHYAQYGSTDSYTGRFTEDGGLLTAGLLAKG